MLYYTLPLNCKSIVTSAKLPKCGLIDSIRQHIHLLFKTHFRENRFDYEYGCLAWDKDYEMIRSVEQWKNKLTESFEQPLKKFETRVSGIKVTTDVKEIRIMDEQTKTVVIDSRKITILVQGTIRKTNEAFSHTEHIYFSPLSMA